MATYDQLGQRMFNNLRIDMGGLEDERFLGSGWSGREQNDVLSFRWAQTLESVIFVPSAAHASLALTRPSD